MYSTNSEPTESQDKGFSLVSQGRDIFNSSTDYSVKEDGFKIFRQGIETIHASFKGNPSISPTKN